MFTIKFTDENEKQIRKNKIRTSIFFCIISNYQQRFKERFKKTVIEEFYLFIILFLLFNYEINNNNETYWCRELKGLRFDSQERVLFVHNKLSSSADNN